MSFVRITTVMRMRLAYWQNWDEIVSQPLVWGIVYSLRSEGYRRCAAGINKMLIDLKLVVKRYTILYNTALTASAAHVSTTLGTVEIIVTVQVYKE